MGVKDVKAGRRRGVSDGRRGERVVNVLFGVEVSFRSKVGARIGVGGKRTEWWQRWIWLGRVARGV